MYFSVYNKRLDPHFLSQYKTSWYTRDQNVLHRWPLYDVKCQCFRGRDWGREGGLPLTLDFQYLIILHNMKSLWLKFGHDTSTSKWQVLKVVMPVFQPLYEVKLKFNVLAFWSHDHMITISSYHKNQICIEKLVGVVTLPHSHPLEQRHFTS